MIPRVTAVEFCGSHSLRLSFHDGVRKQVNLLALLKGLIFAPLLDAAYFRQVLLDPVAGTVVWSNGATRSAGCGASIPPPNLPYS